MEPAQRPDILLVVFDAARADRFGCYGYREAATPTVDALAAAGTRYAQAIAASCWTLESVASLLTGLYPAEHGAHFGRPRLGEGAPTLPGYLQGLGYATLGVSANTAFVGRHTGLDRGFDDFLEIPPRVHPASPESPPLKESASRVAGAAAGLLGQHGRRPSPFFLYLHFVDAHLPFLPAEEAARPFLARIGAGREEVLGINQDAAAFYAGRAPMGPRDFQVLGALYDAELAVADRALREVLEATAALGRPRPLLALLTADHGENLGEQHMMDHAFSLADTLVRVPLVAAGLPQLAGGGVVGEQVQTLDLFPSLVELLDGQDAARQLFPGRHSLLPGSVSFGGREFALAQYTVPLDAAIRERYPDADPPGRSMTMIRGQGRKLVISGDGSLALYDLEGDPAETADLSAADPETVRLMLRRLPEGMVPRRDGVPAAGGDAAGISPELRRKLEGLGYL